MEHGTENTRRDGITSENEIITPELLESFRKKMMEEEKSRLTQEKYMRDLQKFVEHLDGRLITKERVIQFKEKLTQTYAVSSVNSILAAVNRFLDFGGWPECKVKQLKQQRQVYCSEEKELTKQEYYRLIRTAREQKKERLGLLMQTICSTGIRISELEFITVKAVRDGSAFVDCKGKHRRILIPKKLQMRLNQYIKKQKIAAGPVFITSQGNPMDRSNIWKEMKQICTWAGVSAQKVFPHNLRHLFATTYYQMEKDIAKLADLLGHSSINTTRIYILSSGMEHKRQMERLGLVL